MSVKSPEETVNAIAESAKLKTGLSTTQIFILGFMAGAYIAMGGTFMLTVTQDAAQYVGVGVSKLLGGAVFSLGLFLVVTSRAELFTGNCLLPIGVLSGRASWRGALRNLCSVYAANLAGALFFAWLLYISGVLTPQCSEYAVSIAKTKAGLTMKQAFTRGILCNWFVCLAVWITCSAEDVAGKFVAALLPITAFVAIGFEHSVANMFFIPLGIMLGGAEGPSIYGMIRNLIPVTAGNLIGGMALVALLYSIVFKNELTRP